MVQPCSHYSGNIPIVVKESLAGVLHIWSRSVLVVDLADQVVVRVGNPYTLTVLYHNARLIIS